MLTDQPLVTVATELALHLVSRANTSLPGWEKGNVTRPGSRWVRTAAMVGLGVWCHLLLRSEDSYLGWIIFALLRTASFVLLEVLKERGDFASPNEGWLGVEAIVLRVFGMTAVAIVVLAHSLAWSMAWQVLLNVVELGTTFYMVCGMLY